MISLWFLFASLVTHSLLWVLLANLPQSTQKQNLQPVDIVILPHTSQKRIAHTSQSQKNENKISLSKLKPRFWAEKDQQVLNETKAKNLGYLNRQEKRKMSSKEHVKNEGSRKKLSQLGKDLFNEPESQVSDFHDIKEGMVTALNTERFTYYSFFERIDQRISLLWTSKLKEYQSRWTNKDIEKLAGKSWITQIEVLLDKKGNYVKTIIYRSSGVSPIDMAAVASFQASSFPNPPTGMIGQDGFVRLKYAFRFDVEPPRRWARQ